jgi:hypothetical protein
LEAGGHRGFSPADYGLLILRLDYLKESDNLPDPDVLAQEIIDDLGAALEQFREIATDLGRNDPGDRKELTKVRSVVMGVFIDVGNELWIILYELC